MKKLVVAAAFLGIVLSSLAVADDGTPFSRIYKAGEKDVYTVTHHVNLLGDDTLHVDITLTVEKVLNSGRAKLGVHWSNLHASSPNDTTQLPADFDMQTGANNMPEGFTPTNGSADFYAALLQLASATADKPVKLGDETPIAWTGGPMGLKGSVKVVEISADKKVIRTQIKVKMSASGQDIGDITLDSTYDLADCKLVKCSGAFVVDKFTQQFAFDRKKE